MMENSIKMDDLGVPLFLEIPIYIYILVFCFDDFLINTPNAVPEVSQR